MSCGKLVDIKIRMSEALRAKIEAAAHGRGVSMNAEMIARLERSFLGEDIEQAVERAVSRAITRFGA